jgi:hypothetical protein
MLRAGFPRLACWSITICTATTPPRVERKKMLAYDAAQTAELLDAI